MQDRQDETEIPSAAGPGPFWLISASLVVIAFGVASSTMWDASGQLFAGEVLPALPVAAFALYSACGPLAALLALIAGWVRFSRGYRASALKWMIALPVIWLIGLLGWLAALQAFCDGALVCAA
tara:strand:- start:2636 stop:3007 length:372 start_codon:yes stop_codon:yes gene_type:complete